MHHQPWVSGLACALLCACTQHDPDEGTGASVGLEGSTSTSSAPTTSAPGPESGSGSGSSSEATEDVSGSESASTSAPNEPDEHGWQLVWADEFEGTTLDDTHWGHEVNCWGGGNNEQQCYTASPNNSFLADGALHIVAIQGETRGPGVNDDDPAYDPNDTSRALPYSSARVRTRDRFDFRYGRVEVRAQLPQGQGTWPAIWMLPTDNVYGGWASSGEIDIMEAVNLHVDGEARVHGTLHYGGSWPNNVSSGTAYTLPDGVNPADGMHTYALEWERGEIRWYVDDHHYATQREWYSAAGEGDDGAAPFDERFHLLLNLAVGGNWAANVNAGGVDASVFPQELTIDYVRIFACSRDPESGDGCDTIGDDFELVPGQAPP